MLRALVAGVTKHWVRYFRVIKQHKLALGAFWWQAIAKRKRKEMNSNQLFKYSYFVFSNLASLGVSLCKEATNKNHQSSATASLLFGARPKDFPACNKNQNAAYGSSDAFSTRPFVWRYAYQE